MAYSYVAYIASGGQTQFTIPFPYIAQAHVKVKINNVANTSFVWLSTTQIQVTASTANDRVFIYRETSPDQRLVDFVIPGQLTEEDLDTAFTQTQFLSQEALDNSVLGIFEDPAIGTFSAVNKKISNVADPTDAQDAVTKSWAESGMTSQLALADAAQAAALVSQNAALVSQNASEASKVISTAQAVISTTKAAESLASEVISTAKSVISTDKAAIATTKAAEALASQNASSTSETNAAASLDAFNDRFLGSFATAPTVDNDNDALATGAVYWNSTSSRMYAWTGSVWETLKPTNTEQAHISTVAGISSAITTVSNDGTDIGVVAGKSTEIARLGTASAVADMVILGTTDVVSDMNTLAAIQANVTTVADISSNVTTVAGISSNVTSVANNQANINTLVGDMASVNNFANKYRVQSTAPTASLDSGDLWWNTVANELRAYDTTSNVWAATAPTAANQTAIDIVAGDIVYSEDLGFIVEAVTTGSGNSITTVGDSIASVNAVNGSLASVNTVANNIASVNAAASNASNINSAVSNGANITSVAGNESNINAAVGNSSNINSAVSNASNINSAVANASNINSAVANSANINSAVGNASNINLTAGSITSIDTVAGSIADVNRYASEYTISAGNPSSPSAGDLWFDTTNSVLNFYTGSAWTVIVYGIASLVADTTPQLGGALDAQNNNMTNVGTISGSNLQLDFGGL